MTDAHFARNMSVRAAHPRHSRWSASKTVINAFQHFNDFLACEEKEREEKEKKTPPGGEGVCVGGGVVVIAEKYSRKMLNPFCMDITHACRSVSIGGHG